MRRRTINALTAAHGVLIPLECEFFALRGVALNRMRAALSILGVMIGVATLTALLSITQGLSALEREPAGKGAGEIRRFYKWTCRQVGL